MMFPTSHLNLPNKSHTGGNYTSMFPMRSPYTNNNQAPALPTYSYNYQAPTNGQVGYQGAPWQNQFLSSPMSTGVFNQSHVGGLPQGDYSQLIAGTSPLQTGNKIQDYMANQNQPAPQTNPSGGFNPTMMGLNMLMNNGQDYNPTPMDIMGLFSGKM